MINMIVHDTSQGVSAAEAATDGRIYGCLFYYNGYQAPDRGHGHGIYAQNLGSTSKPIYDNIIFQQFGWGIHAYAEGGHLDNFDFQGNISFNNGGLSGSWHANILLGGTQHKATSPKLISNYTYNTDHDELQRPRLRRRAAPRPRSPTTTSPAQTALDDQQLQLDDDHRQHVLRHHLGVLAIGLPEQHLLRLRRRPTGVKVFVRPNAYEAKRAHIVVYNWDLQNTVAVNVSGILSPGDGFEVRNAADFFGAPVLTGTYSGGSITLPMNGLSVATPIGVVAPEPHRSRVQRLRPSAGSPGGVPTATPTGGAATATRTPTRTPTKTPTRTATRRPRRRPPEPRPPPPAPRRARRRGRRPARARGRRTPDGHAHSDTHRHPHAHPDSDPDADTDSGGHDDPASNRGRGAGPHQPDGGHAECREPSVGSSSRSAVADSGTGAWTFSVPSAGHLRRLVPREVRQLVRRTPST